MKQRTSRIERITSRIKGNPIVACLIFLGTIVIALSTFTDAAKKLLSVIPNRESCLRWSPDGKSLQYLLTKGDVTNIWEQPLEDGPPHQLTRFTSGRIFDFNWIADGKLLLSRGEVTSDAVLLSNLR